MSSTAAQRLRSPAAARLSSIWLMERASGVTMPNRRPRGMAMCAAASVMSITGTSSSSRAPSRPCSPNPAMTTPSIPSGSRSSS
jgi:hypothetical protein